MSLAAYILGHAIQSQLKCSHRSHFTATTYTYTHTHLNMTERKNTIVMMCHNFQCICDVSHIIQVFFNLSRKNFFVVFRQISIEFRRKPSQRSNKVNFYDYKNLK